MQPRSFGAMPLLLLFITIIFACSPTPLFAIGDERYLNCSASFTCGNISNIGYPFWESNRPSYCGFPGFQLDCSGQVPVITIEDFKYYVLEIRKNMQTLRVVRTDYLEDVCRTPRSNFTFDAHVFNYTSATQNITLYYDCASDPSSVLPNQFECGSRGVGYYVTSTRHNGSYLRGRRFSEYDQSCGDKVYVPAYKSVIQTLERNQSEENMIKAVSWGFGLRWDANDSSCSACQESGGQCGYNQSTSEFTCYCSDLSCGLPPANQSGASISTNQTGGSISTNQSGASGKSNKVSHGVGFLRTKRGLIIAIAIPTAVGVAVAVLIIVLHFCQREGLSGGIAMVLWWKNDKDNEKIEAFMVKHCSLKPRRYSYSDVKKMTNSFSKKLGQGGCGTVYLGKLIDGGLVAVKVLNKSKADGEEFINEVASISRTSHINIVALLGFCYGRRKMALIYEYLPNGSLEKFIIRHQDQGSYHVNNHLEWEFLYKIALGIARGLEYLHSGCNTRIVHFDIKPHNILLDEDFCPKISDFGLAKLRKRNESIVSLTGARGTIGYIAPEIVCRNFGGVSSKSDVYSYGMMVLDMVGGRKNVGVGVSSTSSIYFPDWLYKHLQLEELSIRYGVMENDEEEKARKMIIVGLWCIQTNPSDRPSMKKVVEMLESSLSSLQIPPKPSFSPPKRSTQEDSSTASSPQSVRSQISEEILPVI